MIEFIKGNLLSAEAEALVNTVNTVGVMGKGIALQFRETFPENYKFYQKACKQDEVQIGKMLVYDNGQWATPRYIINFPTKRHWRERSKIEDVEAGLFDLQPLSLCPREDRQGCQGGKSTGYQLQKALHIFLCRGKLLQSGLTPFLHKFYG